jgi:plastocyanin
MVALPTAACESFGPLPPVLCIDPTDTGKSCSTGELPPQSVHYSLRIVVDAAAKGSGAYDQNPLTARLRGAPSAVVRWLSFDTVAHRIVADPSGPYFYTDTIAPGLIGSVTFTRPGTYTYHCAIHAAMVGTIIVKP